jgi:hypothetical protein
VKNYSKGGDQLDRDRERELLVRNQTFSKEFREDDSSKSSRSNRLRKRRRSSGLSGIEKKTSEKFLKTKTQRIAQTNSAIKLTNFDLSIKGTIFEEPVDDATSVTFNQDTLPIINPDRRISINQKTKKTLVSNQTTNDVAATKSRLLKKI